MLNVYKQEKKLLWNIFDEKSLHKPVLSNFINIILSHLNYSKNFQEYFDSFHQILARFASLGPEARLYLLKIKTVKRLCLFIREYKKEQEYSEEEFALPFYINNPEIGLAPNESNKILSNLDQWYQQKEQE